MVAIKELDGEFFGQSTSHGVVRVATEEIFVDILAGSGIWPGDFRVLQHK